MSKDVLSFVSKILQPSLRERVIEYMKVGRTSGPLIVEFDPTTVCNFFCPECISIDLLNKKSIDTLRTKMLIEEFRAAGVKGIIFIGGGEPLAQRGMPQPIRQCHDLGIAVGLTTNGSLLGKYVDVVSECVAWTRVSVDAANQETFSKFRPSKIKNSFTKVRDNINLLAKSKKGLLGYSFLLIERRTDNDTVISTNIDEVYQAALLARELGCDYFEFKPMVDQDHNLVSLSQRSVEQLKEQLPLLEALNSSRFRVIAPDSITHLLSGTSPHQPKDYTTCPTMELRTLITPTGIYPCPYKRGIDKVKIGEINISFNKYWTSIERHQLASKVNPSTDCLFFCIRHSLNVTLLSLANAYKNGVDLLPFMVSPESGDVFV